MSAEPAAMHTVTPAVERAAEGVIAYVRERLHAEPRPFAVPRTPAEMAAAAGETVTADGIGGEEALRIFTETLAPASVPVENPRFLAFIPTAPTHASKLFDVALSATPMYAGSWRSSAGSVYAENQALRWLADLAGMPQRRGRLLRPGRHRRQPLGARERTPRPPGGARQKRRRDAGGGDRPGAFLGRLGARGHGRGRAAGRARWTRPDDGRRARGGARSATAARACSPWPPPAARPTWA